MKNLVKNFNISRHMTDEDIPNWVRDMYYQNGKAGIVINNPVKFREASEYLTEKGILFSSFFNKFIFLDDDNERLLLKLKFGGN